MNLPSCREAFAAALILALPAALHAGPSAAGTASEAAARAISLEQSALGSSAARVTELSQASRPRARAEQVASLMDADDAVPATTAPARLDLRALDALPQATGDAEWQCLAQAIYFEARGEPLEGQIAVAEVVLNRARDRNFPSTVCGVTRQGAGSGRGCQFSYACDGNSDSMKSTMSRDRSEKLAKLMLDGRPRSITDGATYFHTRSVRPSWSHRMTRTASIGHHVFYRSGTQVAAAD